MKTDNIEKLKTMSVRRKSPLGYMVNKDDVRINYKELRGVTLAGRYDNIAFDSYIKAAIAEKEEELIKRAFELEEQEYQDITREAKKESANILAGEDIAL